MSEAGAEFPRDWAAEVLARPPLIAPARQYVWPRNIAGEEDALARGALQLMVSPASGGAYLLTCALGFRDPSMPTGVYGCPRRGELCAVAGGYAYLAPTERPEECTLLAMKPVVRVLPVVSAGLLLFVGFQTILAWGVDGLAWETGRLSWEGVQVVEISEATLRGIGWDLMADKELEFAVDLGTGKHTGGGYRVHEEPSSR